MNNYDAITKTQELTCDVCGKQDTLSGTFKETIDQAKREGWAISRDGDEWQHRCINCVDKLPGDHRPVRDMKNCSLEVCEYQGDDVVSCDGCENNKENYGA